MELLVIRTYDLAVLEPLGFAVVGAAKAGTTTLFRQLSRHPDLYIPPSKELPYFYGRRSLFDEYFRDAGEYHDYFFADMPAGRLPGVVTPQYMFGAPADGPVDRDPVEAARDIPQRLREFSPNLRVLAILRDPVGRAVSHHRMNVVRRKDSRSFDAITSELLRPEALRSSRLTPGELVSYVTNGEYGRILQGYFDVFGPNQMHIMFTSDLDADPAGVLGGICAFLGVSPLDDVVAERANVGASGRRFERLDLYALQRAARRLPGVRQTWRRLPAERRLRTARQFEEIAYRVWQWNRASDRGAVPAGPVAGMTPPSTETLEALRAHYREDARRLRSLLHCDLPWEAEAAAASDTPARS
jgi:hypothetical protein